MYLSTRNLTDLEILLVVGSPPVQAVDVVADEAAGRLPSVGHVVDSRGSHTGSEIFFLSLYFYSS